MSIENWFFMGRKKKINRSLWLTRLVGSSQIWYESHWTGYESYSDAKSVSRSCSSQSELRTLIQGTSLSSGEEKLRTKPLIPEMCFAGSSDGQLSTPNLDEDGTSPLISCSMCSVRVHTSECHQLLQLLHCVSCCYWKIISDMVL